MMRKKKLFVRFLFVAAITVTISLLAKAQEGDPGDPGDDPDKVPLDPGTWILVAAGAGYGFKKLKDAHKLKHNQNPGTVSDFTSNEE